MPDIDELIAECRAHAERFETNWTLPWYGSAGLEKLWGHPLLRLLLNLPDETFAAVMPVLLAERSFALRGIALHLVNARKSKEHLPRVREILATDESVQVKSLAAAALGAMGLDAANAAALTAIPDSAHPEVKKAAVMALRVGRSAAGVPVLARWLNRHGEDEGVKIAAAAALGDLGGTLATAALCAMLENPSEPDAARSAAAEALGRTGEPEAESALVRTAQDVRSWVRAKTLTSLARLAAARHVELFLDATREGVPWMVRTHAVEALGYAPAEGARARLEQLLGDPEPKVRSEACAALARLGGAQSLTALGGVLADADLLVRLQAVQALAKVSGRTFGLEKEAGKASFDAKAALAAIEKARDFVRTL
jgi:HEAT repeat protein